MFAGRGEVTTNGMAMTLTAPGAFQLIWHEHHTAGELTIETSGEVECLATVFTPGLAPEGYEPVSADG